MREMRRRKWWWRRSSRKDLNVQRGGFVAVLKDVGRHRQSDAQWCTVRRRLVSLSVISGAADVQ